MHNIISKIFFVKTTLNKVGKFNFTNFPVKLISRKVAHAISALSAWMKIRIFYCRIFKQTHGKFFSAGQILREIKICTFSILVTEISFISKLYQMKFFSIVTHIIQNIFQYFRINFHFFVTDFLIFYTKI